MISRHAKTEFRVGAFVLAFAALLLGLLIYIGIKKDLFADRMTFYVISTTGENVERGIPLRLSGFRVGQVNDVDLDHVGKVIIEVELLEKYREWLRKDSQIVLVQGGFIGNSYLQLIPGDPHSPLMEEDTRIDLNKVGGLNEIIAEARPVIEDLKDIVENIKDITDQIVDPEGSVQSIVTNLEALSEDLRSEEGLVGYIARNPEPVIKLDSLLGNTDKAMARIGVLVDTANTRVEDLEPLQKETVALVSDVRGFVAELKAFREDLRPAVDNAVTITDDIKGATKDLERLRSRTEYTIRLGTDLLQRLRRTWPISTGGEPVPPKEHPLP